MPLAPIISKPNRYNATPVSLVQSWTQLKRSANLHAAPLHFMTGIAIPANHAVSGPSSTRGRSHSARPVPQAAHHAATTSRNHKLSVSLARHHSYWTVSNQSVEFNAILLPILIMIDRFALTAKSGNICKPRLAVARRAL